MGTRGYPNSCYRKHSNSNEQMKKLWKTRFFKMLYKLTQHLVITNDMALFKRKYEDRPKWHTKKSRPNRAANLGQLVYYRHWYFITVFSIKSSSNGTQKPITYAMMSNYLFKI